MAHDDLAFTDLTDIADALRKRTLSAVDLTEATLERIHTLEPQLQAFAFVSADHARTDAQQADTELRRGHWRGPLHGVPVVVKDLIETAGIPTEAGMKIFAGNVPTTDATCVARLRAAGAVIVGKTITSEGAFIDHTYTPRPVNPWSAAQSIAGA
jgi:amidase